VLADRRSDTAQPGLTWVIGPAGAEEPLGHAEELTSPDPPRLQILEESIRDLRARKKHAGERRGSIQERRRRQHLEVTVADQGDTGALTAEQGGRCEGVQRSEDQAVTDAVRAVDGAGDAGVVDDREQVRNPGVVG